MAANTGKRDDLDYGLLVLAHLACADQQLHSRELSQLKSLLGNSHSTEQTAAEIGKIFSQNEKLMPLEDVLSRIAPSQQESVLVQALSILYADGFLHPQEKAVLQQITHSWGMSQAKLTALLAEAQYRPTPSGEQRTRQELSLDAAVVNILDLVFSPGLLESVSRSAPASWRSRLRRIRQQVLFAGPEYVAAAKRCAEVAKQDFGIVERELTAAMGALDLLNQALDEQVARIANTAGKGKGEQVTSVVDTLGGIKQELDKRVITDIRQVRESLSSKQRALQYFTIAFMGKSKAGKSTLHAVLTGEGWEAIGVGRQRTTRYNRVYEWQSLRIVDTPGIGAPGGGTDEEIAQSIVDEADVVCYVVTNDSQQESEFAFLKQLKEKAKPLIILLNVKSNLDSPSRVKRFLRDSDRLLRIEERQTDAARDAKDPSGHVARIRRYARRYYANDYFDIIPVQLYAAQLARMGTFPDLEDALYDASRTQDFLDSLRVSLLRDGTIRRSQTLLGCTVGNIDSVQTWLSSRVEELGDLADRIARSRSRLQKEISKAEKETVVAIKQVLASLFSDIRDRVVPAFAEQHWNTKKRELEHAWEQELEKSRIEENLRTAIEEAVGEFSRRVRECLEEIGRDFDLSARLGCGPTTIAGGGRAFPARNLLRFGGAILGIAGTIVMLVVSFSNPVGWVLTIAGVIAGFVSGRFASEDEKRREAAEKIRSSLSDNLCQQQQELTDQSVGDFRSKVRDLTEEFHGYFDALSEGVAAMARVCDNAAKNLATVSTELNNTYAHRVLAWLCQGNGVAEHTAEHNWLVHSVEREFGKQMTIVTQSRVKHERQHDDIQRVLQEDIVLKSVS